jgi:hypothetical protein
MSVTLVLPYPPANNHYYRAVPGRGVLLSAEARRYKKEAGMAALAAGVRPVDGPVALTITLYRPAKRGDYPECSRSYFSRSASMTHRRNDTPRSTAAARTCRMNAASSGSTSILSRCLRSAMPQVYMVAEYHSWYNGGMTLARAWTAEEDAFLRANYLTLQRKEIAAALGRTSASVRKRCSTLHMNSKRPPFTPAQVLRIVQWYAEREANQSLRLLDLARELGHSEVGIQKRAKLLGLTKRGRPLSDETKKAIGERIHRWYATHEHPRGAAGLVHSEETRKAMGDRVRGMWSDPTSTVNSPEFRQRRSDQAVEHALGRLTAGEAMYSRAAHGKRADLDGRYFRSRWEANYARFLNWQVALGAVKEWQYECHTFWFEAITRGTRTYTPDFKVTYPDGRYEWHEVKGWMDAKSKTRLDRMRRYYPQEKLVLIDKGWFAWARKARLSEIIPYWEKG